MLLPLTLLTTVLAGQLYYFYTPDTLVRSCSLYNQYYLYPHFREKKIL